MEGRYWYATYLASKEWEKAKKERQKRLRFKLQCELCGRIVLARQYHHLYYSAIRTNSEWRAIRQICTRCHKYLCHRIFFFILVPRKPIFLIPLFYFWKVVFWGRDILMFSCFQR